MFHDRVLLVLIVSAGLTAAEPLLLVSADHPIVVFQVDAAGVSTTKVVLSAKVEGFAPTSITWMAQTTRINPLAASQPAVLSATTGPTVTATLPVRGVYQMEAVATDGKKTLRRKTWVHVWDNTSVLTPGKVGAYPDLLPPPTVRALSPDPGPFQHPRLALTDRDWPEVRTRNEKDRFARAGFEALTKELADEFDKPSSGIGGLITALDAWDRGAGPAPEVTRMDGDLYGWLYRACYASWLAVDPTLPLKRLTPEVQQRRATLARLVTAAARLQFAAQWDRPSRSFTPEAPGFLNNIHKPGEGTDSGRFRDLANVYDFAYDWMTEAQRTTVRDFLYALGYARHFSAAFSWHPVHGAPGRPMDGGNQNGDFGNLNDAGILAGLVIEGEEDQVSADVRAVFGTPPTEGHAHIWMKPSPTDDPSAWPFATVGSVDNLHRQYRMLNEGFITPWGTWATRGAYMGLSTGNFLPTSLAFARRGENIFVTSYFYSAVQMYLYLLQKGEGESASPMYKSDLYIFDHHDGGSPVNAYQQFIYKYLYPDDPAVDVVYRQCLPGLWQWGTKLTNSQWVSMYGVEPGTAGKTLEWPDMAKAKKLPLLKFDPVHGTVVVRNGWREDDLNVWFDGEGSPGGGHQHAEKNSFSLYALGRAWSSPPGYHVTIHDAQTGISIQDPTRADEMATKGYLGESPSALGQIPPAKGNFPTPPGRLLEVTDDPQGRYALLAGDATAAYTFGYNGERKISMGHPKSWYLYPGLVDYFKSLGFKDGWEEDLTASQADFNPVRHALRTLLVVRGKRPYVLCVDDIDKDGTPRNYRWFMNNASGFYPGGDRRFVGPDGNGVYSSLAIEPGATATQAVLYHAPIDAGNKPGLPRLLVRELGLPEAKGQPALVLESKPPGKEGESDTNFPYGVDNNTHRSTTIPTNRLLIDRNQVVTPGYVVLLFPFRTGESAPRTVWNKERTELTIDAGGGQADRIAFDRNNADHRTRLTFSRGH